MKPVFVPHATYQDFVMNQLREHYSGGILTLVNDDWPVITKLWMTDLSEITKMIGDIYGKRGPAPQDPASMMRSYLLLILTNPTMSVTKWVDELKRVPLYAILSGFEPGNTPGIGTFYDFFARLWGSKKKNRTHKTKSKRSRKRKPKKGKKGGKAPTTTPGRVKRLVEWIIPRLDQKQELPADRLFDFFQSQILTISAKLGLLGDVEQLNVAGDGTPVVTASYTRSKPTCDCRAQGIANCKHPRVYAQPDCDGGWDSSREKYFHGYHLYMINACDSPYDLPLYPRLNRASCHDSVGFIVSWAEFSQRFNSGAIDKILLDAAHDAYAIYEMIDHQQMEPIIDLNKRAKKNLETDSDIQLSPEGVPICPIGKKMKPNGYDHTRHRQKWRCPLACGANNTCETPCSTAKYGRTYHTYTKENRRLFPKLSRETDRWKTIYKSRTSVERSNKREKVDYHLEAGRHRSTMMWYVRIYAIMMCQHIDAWYDHRKDELAFLKQHIFTPAV
ncbi:MULTISPECIES: transposase [Lentibacillus]|uniref:Transposase n=2 Tax=Lentibacillus TaxID=175304 RepID=A0A0U4GD49_9BACI|nr:MULTISPECIES: transposase [Lentibacillus]ALX50666.1 transposase [Lentibacillus amyloliquefaciens]TFJ89944.1 transposase [Lentibacillus salicampi]